MKPRARWIAVVLVALCLILFGAQGSHTQEPDKEYALGDVPLDPETYQKHLKVYPMSMTMALALPSAYDARDDAIVTSAKDQGGCGSCWAFASVGAMESHLQKAYTWGLEDLSEQQQVSCNTGQNGCSGGSLTAPRFWETTGPTRESCFGYTTSAGTLCSVGSGCTQLVPRVVDWHTVGSSSFKTSCYNDGPSYWRYDVYQDFQDWWNSASPGDVYVNQNSDEGNDRRGGHAVLLIGWDDGKGAYLCKNSWGASDGPNGDGTFWIAYSGHYNGLVFQMSNFSLNQPPTADADGPYNGDEGVPIDFDATGSTDPDNDIASYNWDMDGDGQYDDASGDTPSYAFPDNGSYTVGLKVTDDHGQWDTDTAQVTVLNVPPVVTVDIDEQTLQYSDYICDVIFTATDVAADTMTAATTPDPLWDTLALTANPCTVSGGVRTCTWTLAGAMDEQVGDYNVDVEVTDKDGGAASEDTDITVEHEDADISLDSGNLVAVQVDGDGDSPQFYLTAFAKETGPADDVATDCGAPDPGDISNAEIEMTLQAVGPGPSYTIPCATENVTPDGYDAELEVRCTFDNVEVNVYHVLAEVVGDYYTSDVVEDVFVVFDPSLGFTTGGGWFYWPGTTEKTNFGYVMKYNKKLKPKGSLLLIRHMGDGSIYRVKSNALRGLALGDFEESGQTVGWASFTGKCTYLEPGMVEPFGNYRFVTYVEDWNEPGAGFDQFWLEIQDRDSVVVLDMSMDRPGSENTVTLGGGNIVVPHTPGSLMSQ